jgi:SAM-dependent methyltransferase
MKPSYDEEYTYAFHSPGIEPWILEFLKSKCTLGRTLDVGCGLGFSALMLKLYPGNVEYLVGVDISSEKIRKAERLNLYNELHVINIQNFNPEEKFDTLIALEVLHGLPAGALIRIEGLVKKNGSVVLALPALPSEIYVKGLIKRGYNVYRYLLRGFVLIDLESYDIYLAWQSSRFLRVLKLFLTILIPLLKITRILEKGYILAFK